jgi:Diacylglycerol acyltransferase
LVYSTKSLPWLRATLLMYAIYCVVDSTPQNRKTQFVAHWERTFRKYWSLRWVRDFFPCQLHKTTDLDPSERYIFLYHPHGVICMGANIALSTEGCDFEHVFPGVSIYSTLAATFWFLHTPPVPLF